jgi:acyl carrier protein
LTILGIDPRIGIDVGRRLFELGLDSLGAIQLRNRLQADLKMALPATLTLNYPTIEAITGYIARTLPFMRKANGNEKGAGIRELERHSGRQPV